MMSYELKFVKGYDLTLLLNCCYWIAIIVLLFQIHFLMLQSVLRSSYYYLLQFSLNFDTFTTPKGATASFIVKQSKRHLN